MKHAILYLFLVLGGIAVRAQNPIVPPGVYIADPSAHVWSDGHIYVYGSRDEITKFYCSTSYRVLSSGDMSTWKVSEESFSSAGPEDQVPYSDGPLLAPDAMVHDGRYYLYYCMFGENAEGVAVSDSPVGPFLNGTAIDVNGFSQIDPSVFVDDDGQAYYMWGQFEAKMAKLKPNMMEIDTGTIVEKVVTEEEHHFHEGGFLMKRNGIYYFVYADMSRGGAPTCIGYSVSKAPMGPYTYGGVIVDNKFSDPEVWNNHGSLVEFRGQWYVFYHRATHGSPSMRKACVEPITFREDGTIPEVLMTSQGAAAPLNAFEEIDAARACMLSGNVRISAVAAHQEALTKIIHGDRALFRYLDFKDGADTVLMRVAPGLKPCRVTVGTGAWTGSLGTVEIPAKESDEWITVKAAIKPATGIHALWLSFSDPSVRTGYGFTSEEEQEKDKTELCKVDAIWFR